MDSQFQIPPPFRPPGACHLSPKPPPHLDRLLMVCVWGELTLYTTAYNQIFKAHTHVTLAYIFPVPENEALLMFPT